MTGDAFTRNAWLALLARVRAGATLYVSGSAGTLQPFNAPLGVKILSRQQRQSPATYTLDGITGSLSATASIRFNLAATHAEVLGRESDGNPSGTRTKLGDGEVYFLGVPQETSLIAEPGAFESSPFWMFYRRMAKRHLANRVVRKQHSLVGVTEHPLDRNKRVVVAINYSPNPIEVPLALKPGWSIGTVWRGAAGIHLRLPGNDGAVFTVRRQGASSR
jgi:hypothetical protein